MPDCAGARAGEDFIIIESQREVQRLMPIEEIKTKIKEFLCLRLRNYDLQDDEDIFAIGFINSMFAMQLVMFVECEFNVTVEDEDLDLENFRTVNALANFIEHKRELLQQV